MTETPDFNFAEDDFTAADLAKFELIKSEEVEVLNNVAKLLNQMVATKVAKLSQEKDELYSNQLALKELESDMFYNHSPCGYFSTDGNGIINEINDTLLVWLGYAKEDIIGKVTLQSLLSVGGIMYFETHYSPLLQMQGFVQEISFEMVKKDKTRLPILINTKQIRDETGKVQINYSTVFDVSQRKSYEKELLIAKRTAEEQNKLINEINEKLLESEEELKSTIDEIERLNENLNELVEYTFKNASIPIYFISEDASIYNFNDIAAEYLGYTSEEMYALKIYDLDTYYDQKKWVSVWAELKVKKKITKETQYKKKDGTLIDVIVTANYVKFGNLELKCSFVQDITEKKKQEEQLKLLDYSYKNTEIAMFFLDVDGLFIDFNYATANMLGYSYEEFRGKTLMDVNPMVTKESWAERWENLKEIPNQNLELKLKRKDGTFIDVAVSSNSIVLNDKIVNFGFYEDITEKKKAAEDLKLSGFTIDNAAWGLGYVKADGTFYNCNLAFAKIYGITSVEEMKTKTAFDFGSAYTTDTWKQYWDKLKQKKRLHYIVKRTKIDGTIMDLEMDANIIQFGDLELNCVYVNDITEKKNAIEDLKLMDFAFKKSATPIMLLLPTGEFYSYNDALLNLLGYTQEEFSKMNLLNVATKMDEASCINQWDEIREKNNIIFDCHFERKDGTLLDVEVSSNLINYNENEVNFSYINDITEKKKADENLKNNNQRYEYATLATSDVIWESDLLKNEVFISKNFTTIFGHPVSDEWMPMENNIWRQNIHPDDVDNIMEQQYAELSYKESNNKFEGEYRLRKADGSYSTVIDKTFAIKDEEGRILRMVGAMQDITKQREEEERLRLMELVILNTNDSVLITEAEPFDEPGPRIIFGNPAFEKMTGYTTEEVIGLSPRLLQNEDTDRKELDKLRTAMNKWEPCEITVSNSRKNGEKFWNNFSIAPVANEKGWYTHWLAIERDVTKEIEATLEKERMIKELLVNNLDLKQFSYITTHNLRAPLTNLILICKLISRQKIEDPSTLKLIEGFKTSTYQLNETLNDLINGLIVKENKDLKVEKLFVEEILDKVKKSISETLRDSKAIIETDFSDAPTVDFTKFYLESIFLNLITNSIKYRHPERNLIVKIKTIKDAFGRTKLTFSDNGIGMDMSRVKHKIFGFYQRFHKNADSKGIGLFLVRSQINALGGQIEVDSEVNVGTTFTIIFK